MKVLVKPVVMPTQQELLYEALDCPELRSCDCNGEGACRSRRLIDSDDETDNILF